MQNSLLILGLISLKLSRFFVIVAIFGQSISFATTAGCLDNNYRIKKPNIDFTRLLNKNRNARVSLDKYEQPNAREIEEISGGLKFDPKQFDSEDVIVDSGSGIGIAGLQIAKLTGATVISINTQNFWGSLRRSLTEKKIEESFELEIEGDLVAIKIRSEINRENMARVADALGYKWSDFNDFHTNTAKKRIQLNKSAKAFLEELKKLFVSNRFIYVSDYSELVLAGLHNEVTFLFDYWGAYPYSPARLEYLEVVYQALAIGKSARIAVPSISSSEVRIGRNEIDFLEYLRNWNPKIFSIEESGNDQILIITKVPDKNKLKIPLKVKKREKLPSNFAPHFFVFTPI